MAKKDIYSYQKEGGYSYFGEVAAGAVDGLGIGADWNKLAAYANPALDELERGGSIYISDILTEVSGVPVRFIDGTVSAPGASWGTEITSGLYKIGTNRFGFAIAGVQEVEFNSSGLLINNLTATRVLFSGTSGQITDDAEFTYDSTTNFLTIDGLKLADTSNQLVFQSGGVTGTITWTPATSNKTATLQNLSGYIALQNDSVLTDGAVLFSDANGLIEQSTGLTWDDASDRLTIAGDAASLAISQSSTGDALLAMSADSTSWTLGIDNSVSNRFAIAHTTALGTGSDLLRLTVDGNWSYVGQAVSTGSDAEFTHHDFNAAGGTITFTTGSTLATQRTFRFRNPTFAADAATHTITDAATVYIDAAPTASTNVTITNAYALWVDAGNVRLDGDLSVSGSLTFSGLTSGRVVYASTGGLLADDSAFTWDATNDILTVDSVRLFAPETDSVVLGKSAGNTTLTGNTLTGIGVSVFASVTSAIRSTAIGYIALQSLSSGRYNTGLGYASLNGTTTSDYNTGVGYNSLLANTDGYRNTGIGAHALIKSVSADDNTAVGFAAMNENVDGAENTACGDLALTLNVSGHRNVAVGYAALSACLTDENTGVGRSALGGATSGDSNTALGRAAGVTLTTGSDNTFLGAFSDTSVNSVSNATAIGYLASVDASNLIVLGNSSVTLIRPSGNNVADFGDSTHKLKTGYFGTSVEVQNSHASTTPGYVLNQGSTGDAAYFATLGSGASYAWGIDNSASDSWKLSYGSGGNAALGTNDYLTITTSGGTTIGQWLNVGTSTDAAAQGRMSVGLTGAARMFYNATTGVLTMYATDGTDNFTLTPGASDGRLTITPTGNLLILDKTASGAIPTIEVLNRSNTASSSSRLYMSVAGTSAGDPFILFEIVSGSSWTIGGDNSDSDAFKISQNSTLGTNDWLKISTVGLTTIAGTTTMATELLALDQNDADQAFIDFQGTSAANADNNISTWTTGNSVQGHIRIEINGTVRWMPFYDAPTS